MGELGGLIVIAVIGAFLWSAIRESGKNASNQLDVAHEAIRHVSSFLRERTGIGPWFEMDDFYRQQYVDIKCTRCQIDTIFVSNANPSRETEFIDVHFANGKLTIMYGEKTLYNGFPLNMVSYVQEAYAMSEEYPPPKETGAYAAWAQYFGAKAKKMSSPKALMPEEQPSAIDDPELHNILERAKFTIRMSGAHYNFEDSIEGIEARKKHYSDIEDAVRVLTEAGYKVKSNGWGYELEDNW